MNAVTNYTGYLPQGNVPPPAADSSGIDSMHDDYSRMHPIWATVYDMAEGQHAVKAKGKDYLPPSDPADASTKAALTYREQIQRAVYYNVTGRTLGGLVGRVFAKDPITELTPQLKKLKNNIDGLGTTLDQMAKLCLKRTLLFGHSGLLADYPKVADGSVSMADIETMKIRPKLVAYSPFHIRYWEHTNLGAESVLSLVILREVDDTTTSTKRFNKERGVQYRVLYLNTENPAAPYYHWEIWRKGTGTGGYGVADRGTPIGSDKLPFREIPFFPIGAELNSMTPDKAPMEDIAMLNLAHYQSMSSLLESSWICGTVTLVITGLTKEWKDDVFPKGKVSLGSRAGLPLPKDGKAELLQAGENPLVMGVIQKIEDQMEALGAEIMAPKNTAAKTATEAGHDQTEEVSVLSTCADNVSDAITKGLKACGRFIGEIDDSEEQDKILFELSTDFDLVNMTPQERAQLFAEWKGQGITTSEYRAAMRAGGFASLDLEAFKEENANDPLNMPPVPPVNINDPTNPKKVDPKKEEDNNAPQP